MSELVKILAIGVVMGVYISAIIFTAVYTAPCAYYSAKEGHEKNKKECEK